MTLPADTTRCHDAGCPERRPTPPPPNDLSHLSEEQFQALAPQGYHGVGDDGPAVPEGREPASVEQQATALQPMPVSERLPGAKDCDAEAHHPAAARRPKPPSLKEQALALLDDGAGLYSVDLSSDDIKTIRRALEALDD